jgi:hypothetical protein
MCTGPVVESTGYSERKTAWIQAKNDLSAEYTALLLLQLLKFILITKRRWTRIGGIA